MTRFPHDQFAKDYLDQLLSPIGKVETSRDIAGEVREVDRKTGFQASPLQGDFFYATVLMSSFSTSNAGF